MCCFAAIQSYFCSLTLSYKRVSCSLASSSSFLRKVQEIPRFEGPPNGAPYPYLKENQPRKLYFFIRTGWQKQSPSAAPSNISYPYYGLFIPIEASYPLTISRDRIPWVYRGLKFYARRSHPWPSAGFGWKSFAPIVSAHPYCAWLCEQIHMPRRASSARAKY